MNADPVNPQDESSTADSPSPIPSVAGLRIYVTGHNREARRRIEPFLTGATRPGEGPIDLAVITPETVDEWQYFATKALARLIQDGEILLVLDGSSPGDAERDRAEFGKWEEAAFDLGLRQGRTIEPSGLGALAFVRDPTRDSAP